MLIAGSWVQGTDGTFNPLVQLSLQRGDGSLVDEWFLVDTGAEATVLTAETLQRLNLPTISPPPGAKLVGVGGGGAFVLVDTVIQFTSTAGTVGHIHSRFPAFTTPKFTEYSLLGRDILNAFDVIVSRRRDEVWLLRPDHEYQIISP
jgi:hypothetical protein